MILRKNDSAIYFIVYIKKMIPYLSFQFVNTKFYVLIYWLLNVLVFMFHKNKNTRDFLNHVYVAEEFTNAISHINCEVM